MKTCKYPERKGLKLHPSFSVILMLGLVPHISFAESASAVFNVNFEYSVSTCQVTDGKESQSVPMGDIDKSVFKSANSQSEPVSFSIYLSCDSAREGGVEVTFSGTKNASDNTILALDNPGDDDTASGIGLALYDKDGVALPLESPSTIYPAVAGDSQLPFTARYKAVQWPVTAGQANATTTFILSYP
ncbi:fimbrial protein [Citrobacter werkmanii]|uniref:fimbrial protein n=1 Tax=Citrobacter werkmanii TaxID=67827 RepID=UPI0026550ED3|nr:fimbrial protein [Citrobacter werkmanii]MDN8559085.1 fimbrial protein [Citrobacter werkmanii]